MENKKGVLWVEGTTEKTEEKKFVVNFCIKYEIWLKRCRRKFEPECWEEREDTPFKILSRILGRLRKHIQMEIYHRGKRSEWSKKNRLYSIKRNKLIEWTVEMTKLTEIERRTERRTATRQVQRTTDRINETENRSKTTGGSRFS